MGRDTSNLLHPHLRILHGQRHLHPKRPRVNAAATEPLKVNESLAVKLWLLPTPTEPLNVNESERAAAWPATAAAEPLNANESEGAAAWLATAAAEPLKVNESLAVKL